MSEKTLTELIETRLDIEGIRPQDREDGPWSRMFVARIRRAEAAERFADFAAIHHHTDAGEEVYEAAERLLSEYKVAREAVRKMEETT